MRYMEGVCDEGVVRSYIKLLVTTRLAEGLSHTGRIKRENMLNSIEVLSEFRDRASKNGLPVYAYATSAVRDAENGCEFIALARSSAGIDIDLLSGKREAEYSYIGATGGRGGPYRYWRGVVPDCGGAGQGVVSYGNAYAQRTLSMLKRRTPAF